MKTKVFLLALSLTFALIFYFTGGKKHESVKRQIKIEVGPVTFK